MTEQSPNKADLEGLIENYAWHIIDGLDHKSADQMLFDLLTREYEKMSWDEVCLLYTSPSPRDLSTSRMPSSA